jgi:ABC-2 type transport system ATP-binding protein
MATDVETALGRSGGSPIVEVRDLVKRYPKRPVNAVDGVSFQIEPGEVFGLLGPNGAGKTTTIGILTTRIRPTGGQCLVDGLDVATQPVPVKARIGVVTQRPNLDRAITARQNLLFHAAYFGMSRAERTARADALLREFGLAERGDDRVDRYSGGQQQRLMIARALIHEPVVLFLDEPTTGLDPQARLFVWDRVRTMRERGVTVLLTTHDMDEATELADRVAIMDHGRLLAMDTPAALAAGVPGSTYVQVTLGDASTADSVVAELTALPCVLRAERLADGSSAAPAAPAGPWGPPAAPAGNGDHERGDGVVLRLYGEGTPGDLVVPIVQHLAARGAPFHGLKLGQASLEDVFIQLTGRGLRG